VRVKISYGVDIEDVPSEIEQLFDYVYEKKSDFEHQLDLVEKLLEEKELKTAVDTMDKIRLILADMDNRISDVAMIAQGYVTYKEQEGAEDVSEGRPSMDTVRDGVIDTTTEQPTVNQDNE
jgi:hypothetical protein